MGKIIHFLITVIILILIVLLALTFWFNGNIVYQIIDVGYKPNFDNFIISNMDEYNSFMEDSEEEENNFKKQIPLNKEYSDEFFKNRSLALVYIPNTENGEEIVGIQISTILNRLIVTPRFGSAGKSESQSGKLIVVEVHKFINKIIEK